MIPRRKKGGLRSGIRSRGTAKLLNGTDIAVDGRSWILQCHVSSISGERSNQVKYERNVNPKQNGKNEEQLLMAHMN
jgi:hypothetical protein